MRKHYSLLAALSPICMFYNTIYITAFMYHNVPVFNLNHKYSMSQDPIKHIPITQKGNQKVNPVFQYLFAQYWFRSVLLKIGIVINFVDAFVWCYSTNYQINNSYKIFSYKSLLHYFSNLQPKLTFVPKDFLSLSVGVISDSFKLLYLIILFLHW